jgi:hypothetical protein
VLAEGSMAKAERVAEISAGSEVAGLIREGALQHQDLFTAGMIVTGETGARVVTHNGSGMAAFGLCPCQRFAPHTSFGAWHPAERVGVEHHALSEIHVKHKNLVCNCPYFATKGPRNNPLRLL